MRVIPSELNAVGLSTLLRSLRNDYLRCPTAAHRVQMARTLSSLNLRTVRGLSGREIAACVELLADVRASGACDVVDDAVAWWELHSRNIITNTILSSSASSSAAASAAAAVSARGDYEHLVSLTRALIRLGRLPALTALLRAVRPAMMQRMQDRALGAGGWGSAETQAGLRTAILVVLQADAEYGVVSHDGPRAHVQEEAKQRRRNGSEVYVMCSTSSCVNGGDYATPATLRATARLLSDTERVSLSAWANSLADAVAASCATMRVTAVVELAMAERRVCGDGALGGGEAVRRAVWHRLRGCGVGEVDSLHVMALARALVPALLDRAEQCRVTGGR